MTIALFRDVLLMEQAAIEEAARRHTLRGWAEPERTKLLDWQHEPWADQSPTLLLTGSAGGGKSWLAAEKLHWYCRTYPRATGVMLRKTRQSTTNSIVIFMERTVIRRDPFVKHFPSKSRFEYTNGSVLAYGGMADDEQREQIRSIGPEGGVDIAWMEEATAFSEDDFNELNARMRGTAGHWRQVILTTNPDAPTHWINTRLILGDQASIYYSSARDNPYNPENYLETLNNLTGILALRLRDGKWVQAEGAVYEDWDQAVHLIDSFAIPEDWRRFRVVDFGYVNPFVCQWWAVDPDGRMYRYRELYRTQRTVRTHAEQIKVLSDGERFEATVADHDAEDRATMSECGIPTVPAVKDVSRGIQAVAQRLRKGVDGKPRLFLFRGATVETDSRLEQGKKPTSTEMEFPGYVWPKGSDGKPLKEVPMKLNDHGLDALRYAVMYLDGGRATLRESRNPFYALEAEEED